MDFLLKLLNFIFRCIPLGLTLLSVLNLSGCATVSTPNSSTQNLPTMSNVYLQHQVKLAFVKNYKLKGRLGVVTQKQGFSGGIVWQHDLSTDNIDIFSPLGGKVANIAKNAAGVTLTNQDGHTITAKDAESLTEATLGFRLPLAGLSNWALGKPTSSKIDAVTNDESGHLLTLKQDGWDIVYEGYTVQNGIDLPSKIVLKSEKVNLKLLVELWVNESNKP